MTAFWTIATASLCSLMCSWLGIWLVLQRLSMIGDAISHSVLPGLIAVFILFGTHASFPMVAGAAFAGLLTVFLMRSLSQIARIHNDSSLGIVFTVFFALGVILITRYARDVDLDPSCVLYGLIEFVTLDTLTIFGLEVPRAMITIFPILIIIILFIGLFYKELVIMAFDTPLALTLGKKPNTVFYALMAMVALATVASFELVGSILVVAMLIGPPTIAQLLTQKLKTMFILSGILAILSSIFGYLLAATWNTSVAGMMTVILGIFYIIALFLSSLGKRYKIS